MSAGRLRPVLATTVQVTLNPEFLAHMPELHGIQQAPVLREVTQGSPTRLGEVSARPTSIRPQFHQTTLGHGAHGGWQLRLPCAGATAPCAQQDALGRGRVLAELHAQGSPDQVAFRRGEYRQRGLEGGRA